MLALLRSPTRGGKAQVVNEAVDGGPLVNYFGQGKDNEGMSVGCEINPV